jgi:Zn-finger nucleic acid-binding protein
LVLIKNRGESIVKCPNCKDTKLIVTKRQGIEIGYCPECQGVWLDQGKLDAIIERSVYSLPKLATADSSLYPCYDTNYYKPKCQKPLSRELFD